MKVSFHVVQKESGPVEYVKVEVDHAFVLDRAATDDDRLRWPKIYAAFKEPGHPKDDAPWAALDAPLSTPEKPIEKPKAKPFGKIWKPKKDE